MNKASPTGNKCTVIFKMFQKDVNFYWYWSCVCRSLREKARKQMGKHTEARDDGYPGGGDRSRVPPGGGDGSRVALLCVYLLALSTDWT